MATFIPATGTLRSTTLENALLEANNLLLSRELDPAINPANERRVSFSLDQNLIYTGVCTFPGNEVISTTDGSITWSVNNYLTGTAAFTPGTGGTLRATNLPAAIIEIAKRMQNLEVQPAKNNQGLNNIRLSYDSEGLLVRLEWQMPVSLTISTAGLTTHTARVYLTD